MVYRNMPGGGGLKVARTCGETTNIVMLTVSEAERDLLDAVAAGASGYLVKSTRPEELRDALWRAANGEPVFSPQLASLVLGEFRRMSVSMKSRAYDPSWIGQAKPYAQGVGRLFVKSYERGERVYLAMASRGYVGHMPASPADQATIGTWAAVLAIPAAAWTIAVAAIVGAS